MLYCRHGDEPEEYLPNLPAASRGQCKPGGGRWGSEPGETQRDLPDPRPDPDRAGEAYLPSEGWRLTFRPLFRTPLWKTHADDQPAHPTGLHEEIVHCSDFFLHFI